MKPIPKLALASAGTATFAALVSWIAHGSMLAQTEFPEISYELVTNFYKGEETTETQLSMRAIRSDGSSVAISEVQARNGTSYTRRTIENLRDKTVTIVYSGIDSIITIPISAYSG